MIVCPGCGGRNESDARSCEWCARSFVVDHRPTRTAWLTPSLIAVGVALALVSLLVALVVTRSWTSPAVVLTPEPITERRVAEPAPRAEPDEPSAGLAQDSLGETVEFVLVTNTGGTGVFIRREPRNGATGIVAQRDGTLLRVIGADVVADDGVVWRNVEDRQANRGWTPRDYLSMSDLAF